MNTGGGPRSRLSLPLQLLSMEISSNQPIFGTKFSTNVKIENIFIAYSLFLGKKFAKSEDFFFVGSHFDPDIGLVAFKKVFKKLIRWVGSSHHHLLPKT